MLKKLQRGNLVDVVQGQTTEEHESLLKEKAKCVRHLLPTVVTSEIQLIDNGIGCALMNEMGKALDKWMEEGSNLELWTGDTIDTCFAAV